MELGHEPENTLRHHRIEAEALEGYCTEPHYPERELSNGAGTAQSLLQVWPQEAMVDPQVAELFLQRQQVAPATVAATTELGLTLPTLERWVSAEILMWNRECIHGQDV